MIIEIILFVAIIAFVSSLVSLWAFSYVLKSHKRGIVDIQRRLYYLEVGMSYHGFTPLPWEIEDLDETETFKREGNVVYLKNSDTYKEL